MSRCCSSVRSADEATSCKDARPLLLLGAALRLHPHGTPPRPAAKNATKMQGCPTLAGAALLGVVTTAASSRMLAVRRLRVDDKCLGSPISRHSALFLHRMYLSAKSTTSTTLLSRVLSGSKSQRGSGHVSDSAAYVIS
ncbi:hypothetical protein GX51_03790 [Blastomyces parvus]|uniref:Uncharacterized protein n=1 Tax=Blastomyces parvus TaxID=2060905 RepID=A0A2B7X593_9EURO|nr:hypothetical protein GX51_03790 [Blastomyces parvus]